LVIASSRSIGGGLRQLLPLAGLPIEMSDHAGRGAHCDRKCGDGRTHNGVRADDAMLTDRDAGQDDDILTEPSAPPDENGRHFANPLVHDRAGNALISVPVV